MPQRLKKEIDLIATGLRSTLAADALFTDKGKMAIASYGAKSGNIVLLDDLTANGIFYSSPGLFSILGYTALDSDIHYSKLFHCSDFYDEYSKYLRHFSNAGNLDYEGTLKLPHRNGHCVHLFYVSRLLSGFGASGTAAITLMAPCSVAAAAPVAPNGLPVIQCPTEEALAKFRKLRKECQETLKYLAQQLTHEEIAAKIFRGKDTVEKYVRKLKDIFKVNTIHDLVDIYKHYIRIGQI